MNMRLIIISLLTMVSLYGMEEQNIELSTWCDEAKIWTYRFITEMLKTKTYDPNELPTGIKTGLFAFLNNGSNYPKFTTTVRSESLKDEAIPGPIKTKIQHAASLVVLLHSEQQLVDQLTTVRQQMTYHRQLIHENNDIQGDD